MSSVTYEELYREAMVDLSEMQEQDGQCVGRKIGVNKKDDYAYFLHHWCATYLRYLQIAQKLEKVHDQMLQPQKRYDVRVLLDSCIGRMLEMKFKIVEYCGEYVNLNEALVDLKLTPGSLEIPIPKYFVEDRLEEIAERRNYIKALISHYRSTEADAPVTLGAAATEATNSAAQANLIPMSLEQAVMVLQTNERGRQGRQRAKFHKTIYEQEIHQHREFEYGTSTGKDHAATRIQKIVLGYLARKRSKAILQAELEFLGMEPSAAITSDGQQLKALRTAQERKTKQLSNIAELDQEAKELRSKVKIQEGGKAMEAMLDEILVHLANIRLTSKEDVLPAFPTEEEGGSLALLGIIKNPTDADNEAAEVEAAAAPAAKGKKAPPKKEGGKAGKGGDEEEALPTLAPSLFWDRFSGARERYAQIWHTHFQNSYFDDHDLDQHYDKKTLHRDVMEGPGGVVQELRRCVDQLVMVEVNNLRERMEREKGGKKKKGKKGKGKKGKKIKVKDPTDGTKLETFMNSAVFLNIMQLPDETIHLRDYLGAHDAMGDVMQEHLRLQAEQADIIKTKWQAVLDKWDDYAQQSLRMSKEQFELLFKGYCDQSSWMFEPSMLQVRQAVTEYCILPLGSQVIHDSAPHHNGVLLYGFPKTGKTMLVHAVCNESGANLFNLSPATFNPGAGAQKIIQMIFRIARSLAPSVIYIDQVEKIFAGKGKGKKKKGDPIAARAAKMKKDIIAGIKELEPTDRVVVIGVSSCPWEGDMKDLTNNFRGMVCCVHPDYASRMTLWQNLIKKKGALLPNDHDAEILSYMTNKYTSGAIVAMVDETLTERRLKRLQQRPLKVDEFLPALSRATPIFREDYALMKEFVLKLPLTARRVTDTDFKEAEAVDPKAKGKPGAKPAGKKK